MPVEVVFVVDNGGGGDGDVVVDIEGRPDCMKEVRDAEGMMEKLVAIRLLGVGEVCGERGLTEEVLPNRDETLPEIVNGFAATVIVDEAENGDDEAENDDEDETLLLLLIMFSGVVSLALALLLIVGVVIYR